MRLLLGAGALSAYAFIPNAPPRPRAVVRVPAFDLFHGDASHFLLALDFNEALDSVKDAANTAVDSANAAKDTVTAAADSVVAAKDSAIAAKDAAISSTLDSVNSAKDSAVSSVMAPVKQAQAALPPLPDVPLPDVPLPKVSLPPVSLPASLPSFGGGEVDESPFAALKATLRTAGIGGAFGLLLGGKLGWEARGLAEGAGKAKDAVVGQVDKAKKAMT